LKQKWITLILMFFMITGCSQLNENASPDHSNNVKIEDMTKGYKRVPFHGVKDKQGRLNVLIVGVDSRGEKQSRSDAIIIAQYDPKSKKAKLVSIMRDSYVKIPNYSKGYNKINTSYYLGGPDLLRRTIKENFGIDVEHFLAIDFKGFVKVVDMIAPQGIEVDIKKEIIEDMGLKIQPGRQRLHGKELLAYARFRHDSESDFGRVKRQQEVLTALKDTFTSELSTLEGMFRLPGVGQELMSYIDTDMDFQTLVAIGGSVLLNPIAEVETMRIPLNASYENKRYDHAGAVLQLDFGKNQEALKEFLINEPKPVNELNK
jgi:LCP family protein required for cell wall assembly